MDVKLKNMLHDKHEFLIFLVHMKNIFVIKKSHKKWSRKNQEIFPKTKIMTYLHKYLLFHTLKNGIKGSKYK